MDQLDQVLRQQLLAMDSGTQLLYIMSLKKAVDNIYNDYMDAIKDDPEIELEGMVFLSRYTPGLENAKDIRLDEGECVTWRSFSGQEVELTLDSGLMRHENGKLGYEAIFHDTDERAFACADQIVNWEGKDGEENCINETAR